MKNLLKYNQFLILEQGTNSCPITTQNLELNDKNKKKIAEDHQYGEQTEEAIEKNQNCANCIAFDISPRMKECMENNSGEIGYCWMHQFMCSGKKWCNTWVKGGPITEDQVSADWQSKNEGELNEKRKTKNSPDWHDSDAPDANGKFKELGVKELAKWLIRTRGGDMRKITGSLNQQIVFNRNDNPSYAKKMESVRAEVKRQLAKRKK
jgi:hypothetical protein